MTDIHTRIKDLRTNRGMSMEKLATAVGVTWQTVQQWEKPNGTAPKRERLQKVASVLGTTKTYLLDGDPMSYAPIEPTRKPESREPRTPPYSRPLVKRLFELAETIDDSGLQGLVEVAQCFTKTHPRKRSKAA